MSAEGVVIDGLHIDALKLYAQQVCILREFPGGMIGLMPSEPIAICHQEAIKKLPNIPIPRPIRQVVKHAQKILQFLCTRGFFRPGVFGGSPVNPSPACFGDIVMHHTEEHLAVQHWLQNLEWEFKFFDDTVSS